MNTQPPTIAFCIPLMNLPVSNDEVERLLQPMFMPPLLPAASYLPAPAAPLAFVPATGRIEGVLLRSDTQAPVTDASLFLIGPTDNEWLAWDIAVDHGAYTFGEVRPGDYSLTLIWDQSGGFQDDLDEIVDFGWEGNWLVSRGKNGVVVATAPLTIADGEVLRKDWDASFIQP
jgi:hypothetical protein